jgi:uncharacterized membrane protein YfcA
VAIHFIFCFSSRLCVFARDNLFRMELLTYMLTGAAAGLMAGLLGIGGGLIIVPVLATLFVGQGFNPVNLMHFAIGTSLATIVFTSISSLVMHHRRGAVLWPVVSAMVPGIILGALAGALLAKFISSPGLGRFFGGFEILVAAQLVFGSQPAAHRSLAGRFKQSLAGGVIGLLSTILGIGGGTLTVPYLVWHRVDIRMAVGTAAACGLPIALAGTVGFVIAGLDAQASLIWRTGFIYWPAALAITAASVLFAPLGARLAHALPREVLRRIFALLLLLLGLKMLLGS